MPKTSKDRCINLTAHEVRGILDGSITQLRRAAKLIPNNHRSGAGYVKQLESGEWEQYGAGGVWIPFPRSPFGEPGDRLIGREAARYNPQVKPASGRPICAVTYEADDRDALVEYDSPESLERVRNWLVWNRSAALMPRWASRLPLRVKLVRVQQLGDATEEDAKNEGHLPIWGDPHRSMYRLVSTSLGVMQTHWDANAKPGEEWNPNLWTFVAAIEREGR